MDSVYDVIEALQRYNGYSMRDLATEAGVSHTTISSMFSRRSARMNVSLLAKIATAFGVSWRELLGREVQSFGDNIIDETTKPAPKVATALTPEMICKILSKLIGDGYESYLPDNNPRTPKSLQFGDEMPHTNSMFMKRSIGIILDKLNEDGLMEAMRKVLEVANEQRYINSRE